jgi:hypothetical protein
MPRLSLRRKPQTQKVQQEKMEPKAEAVTQQASFEKQTEPKQNDTEAKGEVEQKTDAKIEADQPKEQITLSNQPVKKEAKSKKDKKEKTKKEPKKAALKIIKGSSFVKKQKRKYLALTALCIVVFCLLLVLFSVRAVLLFSLGLFEIAGLLACIVPAGLAYFFMHKYRVYRGGADGEKEVNQQLKRSLNNDYTLINNLFLKDGGGDIDHILLAPNGVFVLETKNWKGKISCFGDVWQRQGMRDMGSPSRQVRRNAAKIKRIIDVAPQFRDLNVYVEGIVVFTNKHATLDLKNPTVAVVKAPNVTSYITKLQTNRVYTKKQLEEIQKELFNPNIKRVLRRNF